MDAKIIAALIGAAASLPGVVYAIWKTRADLRIAKESLEVAKEEIRREWVAVRNDALGGLLEHRATAYSALWNVLLTYNRNWTLENKPLDTDWAWTFLAALNHCNAEHGVFFSEAVYAPFARYRTAVQALAVKAKAGKDVLPEDLQVLTQISAIGDANMKALGAALKDDLGSYVDSILRAGSARSPNR